MHSSMAICRNVISEYRRRNMRDEPMPEVVPEPPGKAIPETDLFELARKPSAMAWSSFPSAIAASCEASIWKKNRRKRS